MAEPTTGGEKQVLYPVRGIIRGVQTETANKQAEWNYARARRSSLARVFGLRLAAIIILALVGSALAYQTRPIADISVGWFGDRMFLPASAGLGQSEATSGHWYGDELTGDSPTGRARWTRTRAAMTFPNFGARGSAELIIQAQGWPEDVVREPGQLRQPVVTVAANNVILGDFTPTSAWKEQRLSIPAEALGNGDLHIELSSPDSFTNTSQSGDIRPKVLRVARVQVIGGEPSGITLPPFWPMFLLICAGSAAYFTIGHALRRPNIALFIAALSIIAGALAVAYMRAWAGALLPWVAAALLIVLALAYAADFRGLLADGIRHIERTGALRFGLTAAFASGLLYLFAQTLIANFAALGLLVVLLAALLLSRSAKAVRQAAALVAWLNTRRGALVVLSVFLIVWLGYEAWIVFTLAGVGHADYSDNAVVARNLVQGRGWVVDYVTQFYRLYPGLVRPQETWPLLQPVWIAPFFLLFGATDWAAKLPNLIFTLVLAILVYRFGARHWGRRIGLTATILLLTSYLFFLLVINVTSDLGFVVLSFAVIGLVYAWGTGGGRRTVATEQKNDYSPSTAHRQPPVLLLGLLTGLMLLQKPANGVFVAAGCGLWLLWRNSEFRIQNFELFGPGFLSVLRRFVPLLVWTGLTLAIFTPYLVRNLALSAQNNIYGSFVYSTESRDAWVWGYAPREFYIYQIYTPEAGLSETQGLPDRSWILRWGFDRTLEKVENQVEAVRDYLSPAWSNLPNGWSEIVSGRESKRLFFVAGAWLSFLGLASAIRNRGSLVALLGLAFLPYTLFLTLYWHADEERYFVALMPWLALFAALAVWRIYGWLAAAANGRFGPVAVLVACLLVAAVVAPSGPEIGKRIKERDQSDSDRVAYEWLRTNTRPDEAVMTRVPWQLNWHAERPALMIPATTSREKLLQLARYYRIRYLVVDVGQRPDPATRKMLDDMLSDKALGFTVAYESPVLFDVNPTRVYRFPADYGGVPELRP